MEQDPKEILQSVHECVERTCEKLKQLNIDITNIKGTTEVLCVCFSGTGVSYRNAVCLVVFKLRSAGPQGSVRGR